MNRSLRDGHGEFSMSNSQFKRLSLTVSIILWLVSGESHEGSSCIISIIIIIKTVETQLPSDFGYLC
ncbi:Uncharacterized protein TCM_029541 [Theobroma cacao]|uniref:Uncharacterized protein n=1 Tax=Theobroma cacao TaxID=3641 RepID=A0A061GDY5_THECC|nr:Uncharacterized protein TCM_029541 [Theobroma cacao]